MGLERRFACRSKDSRTLLHVTPQNKKMGDQIRQEQMRVRGEGPHDHLELSSSLSFCLTLTPPPQVSRVFQKFLSVPKAHFRKIHSLVGAHRKY